METARELRAVCGDMPFIYRAGVWKPRTSPRTFQGVGEEALAWLNEVKQTLGLDVATEVATPEHVEAALHAGMDYLWIGARTSANPIAVEAIASSIPHHSSPITNPKALIIKNPVNADPNLWLGNIERLEQTGIPVIVIHRGCNHQPCWKMAHIVRLARPDIPMLLDPSHMSGDAAKVPDLLTKISELDLNGAMVEVHAHPDSALSDAKQQITPKLLRDCFEIIRNHTQDRNETELNWLRAEIDECDNALWSALAARMDVSRRIGEWKKAHGVQALQPQRYRQIQEARQTWATQNGVPAAFVKTIMDLIHEQSLKEQE